MLATSRPGSLGAQGAGKKRRVGKSQRRGARWVVPADVPTPLLDCGELHWRYGAFSVQTDLPGVAGFWSVALGCLCINNKGPANVLWTPWLGLSPGLQASSSNTNAAAFLRRN